MTPDPSSAAAFATPSPAGGVLRTLLLCDLVDSTHLTEHLGDARAAEVFGRHDQLARSLAARCGGHELNQTDGFLFDFDRPHDAVTFSLQFHEALGRLTSELGVRLLTRVGIHLGEIRIVDNTPEEIAHGATRQRTVGIAIPVTARIMSLAGGGQTLLTKAAFDLARRAAQDGESLPAAAQWLAHGPYLFKGIEDPLEVFEVGVPGTAPLVAPADTEKVRRAVAPGDEVTLGWRPAVGLEIPGRPSWIVRERLGEGGFGEVWLGVHAKSAARRVFKFCFEAERLRGLKREVALFRLLRDALGERDDIARVIDWQFEESPYFLESEHTEGGSLLNWAREKGGMEKVPLARRLEIVVRVARALAAAHSVGILHRDIKPSNILIADRTDRGLDVRLTDFGIGTVVDPRLLETQDNTLSGLTEMVTGVESSRTGTRIYQAPERLEGKPPTVQGDVYSLGVMLYQLVIGQPGKPLAPGWEGHVHDRLLREDIAACVAGDPDQRLPSARDLADRLATLEERRRQRRRRRLLSVTAAASIVLVLAAGGFAAAYRHEAGLYRRAESARVDAEKQKDLAIRARQKEEAARATADGLIRDILLQIYPKAREVGRLDLLEPAAKLALGYFQTLPSDRETSTTKFQRCMALEDVAGVFEALSQREAQLGALEQERVLLDELLRDFPGEDKFARAVFTRYEALARTYRKAGDWVAALRLRDSEVTIIRGLLVHEPNRPRYLKDLSECLRKRATIHWDQGRQSEARRDLAEAADLLDKAAARAPADLQVTAGMLDVRSSRAQWESQLGNHQPALVEIEAALQAGDALIKASPRNGVFPQKVARILGDKADILHLLGRDGDANTANERQLTLLRQLCAEDPRDYVKQKDLANAFLIAARLRRDAHHPDDALQQLGEAEAILRRVSALDVNNVNTSQTLATALEIQGMYLAEAGRPADARKSLEECVRIYTPIYASLHDRASCVTLALAHLLLGNKAAAAPLLEVIDHNGWKEPDLEKLRK